MEDSNSAPAKNVVKVLAVVDFEIFDVSLYNFIKEVKSQFNKVHLTAGLVKNTKFSILKKKEKLQLLRRVKEINEIKILKGPVTDQMMVGLGMDYVVNGPYVNVSQKAKLLEVAFEEPFDVKEVIRRIIVNKEKFQEMLILENYTPESLGVSRATAYTVKLNWKLKNICESFSTGFEQRLDNLLDFVDDTRNTIRTSSGSYLYKCEKTFKKWLTAKAKTIGVSKNKKAK